MAGAAMWTNKLHPIVLLSRLRLHRGACTPRRAELSRGSRRRVAGSGAVAAASRPTPREGLPLLSPGLRA